MCLLPDPSMDLHIHLFSPFLSLSCLRTLSDNLAWLPLPTAFLGKVPKKHLFHHPVSDKVVIGVERERAGRVFFLK